MQLAEPDTESSRPHRLYWWKEALFVTAFYLGRMVILTFFGQGRSEAAANAHESRGLMLLPLAVLASASLAACATTSSKPAAKPSSPSAPLPKGLDPAANRARLPEAVLGRRE